MVQVDQHYMGQSMTGGAVFVDRSLNVADASLHLWPHDQEVATGMRQHFLHDRKAQHIFHHQRDLQRLGHGQKMESCSSCPEDLTFTIASATL